LSQSSARIKKRTTKNRIKKRTTKNTKNTKNRKEARKMKLRVESRLPEDLERLIQKVIGAAIEVQPPLRFIGIWDQALSRVFMKELYAMSLNYAPLHTNDNKKSRCLIKEYTFQDKD
jgi:hypothetical protein